MTPYRRLHLLFFLGLVLSIICAGCATKTTEDMDSSVESPTQQSTDYPGAVYEQGDDTYPEGYYIHTVTLPDESISIIAKWFTGDLKNWEVLAKCNPAINPNRIFMGDKIKIPREIMTRQDPMTAEFVVASQPEPKRKQIKEPAQVKRKKPAAESPPDPTAEDEPILFGPKGYSKE